ncbi:hypothetical protein NG895_04155 [Aeoliella sp. ICT_H6.2]|uniref:Uncharacterized protein n=1 Tax=Aeoliella straminimaris TaxID=2954799 RepID=A0A9X2F777_9BACT|nr:hypothetical protein [Aeoliella straminimaris]MCO6043089.1 hypothetical protein [Aeoliella straminimaris]
MNIEDDNLKDAIERQKNSPDSLEQQQHLLSALLEAAVNAESDPGKRLKLAESVLISQQKLAHQAQKLGLDRKDLLAFDEARLLIGTYLKAIFGLVREVINENEYAWIVDSVQPRIFDMCLEDENLKSFMYRSDAAWSEACSKFTGEPRERLDAKLLIERGRGQKRLSNN